MVDVFIAMIAGLVSFLSPCVLPLVPAYVGYMGGRVTNTVAAQVALANGKKAKPDPFVARFSTFMHGIAFVVGFTFVFVTLGIVGKAFVQEVGSTASVEGMIARIGGMLVIIFGLHFMGIVPKIFVWLRHNDAILASVVTSLMVASTISILIAWGFTGTVALWDTMAYVTWTGVAALVVLALFWAILIFRNAFVQPRLFWVNTLDMLDYAFYADTRRQMTARGDQGLAGSALMGVVFAAGWTPCIGPTLGLAWTLAANGSDIPRAALLMTAYSLGLGIPFLITALALDSAQGGLRRLKKRMHAIQLVSGVFLVYIGFMVTTGSLQDFSNRFTTGSLANFSVRLEECTVGILEGDVSLGDYFSCLDGDDDTESVDGLQEREIALAVSTPETNDPAAEIEVGLAVNNLAPDFQTVTTTGEMVSLSDFRGKMVLLNFWFTYCGPCQIEMPEFQAAFTAHAADGFTILAVNRKQNIDEVTAFGDDLGLTFPLLLDEDGNIQDLYNISGYPSTFVIDPDGVIVFVRYGALTADEISTLAKRCCLRTD